MDSNRKSQLPNIAIILNWLETNEGHILVTGFIHEQLDQFDSRTLNLTQLYD